MAKVLLRGACLHEADLSGAQLDGAVLTRADLQRRTCVGPDFAMRGRRSDLREARLGGAPPVGASLGGAVCVARICAWQSSTVLICMTPICTKSKGSPRLS
jgi:uncharacterized protein YjbI with pentapeptide repeats